MNSNIEIARQKLLEPAEIGERELDSLLGTMTGARVDHADMYFQHFRSESWALEEGIVKYGSFNIDQGVGLRVVSGEKTGFAYSDDLNMKALAQAASVARGIADGRGGQGQGREVIGQHQRSVPQLYGTDDPLLSMSEDEKVELLENVEQEARRCDARVQQVMAQLYGEQTVVMVVRSDGVVCADVRPLIRINIAVVTADKSKRGKATFGTGSRESYDFLTYQGRALECSREAVRQSLVNLSSVDGPAGTMSVVLGPGWPGILLHEAVGHGLEGDFNRKRTSAYSDRIGQRVASELCTVVDDGTMDKRRGSLNMDDEGTQTQNTVLIENGVLSGYMQDLTNARLMGHTPTGNGRRQSFAHLPMPRMTNTYMLPGESEHEEIVESVKYGLYAAQFNGGQVDITSGNFVFSATEAYLIENGKLTTPVQGATLIGNGPDALTRVSMVGNNLELDAGIGTCGKNGQSVPVGVGQPTLRIDGLTVGGVVV